MDASQDEDAVSLPPSVAEDAAVDEDVDKSSEVSLPAPVDEDIGVASACCKKGQCPSKFSKEWLEAYKLKVQSMSLKDRHPHIYHLVKRCHDDAGENASKRIIWKIEDKPVCRRFWEQVHGIGPGQLDHMVGYAKAGQSQLPSSAPRLGRATPAMNQLDVWFLRLYQELAEPLAIPGSGDDIIPPEFDEAGNAIGQCQHEVVKDVNHPLYALATNASRQVHGQGKDAKVPLRYLNFESVKELWNFYQVDEDMTQQASRDTFNKAWQSWKNFVPLKNAGQQSKCTICAELSVARTEATEAAVREDLDLQKKQHLDVVMADRRVNVRGNKLSESEKVWAKGQNDQLFFKLQLDGMDQSKFSLPRMKRLIGTSLLQKIWRPSMHIVGCLVFGMLEYYAVLPSDCPKDASMNCTIVSRVIDILAEKLHQKGEGFCFPGVMIVNVDNTPRESKNSIFGSYLASPVSRDIFREVECQYLQCDHTHNELDQRFSSMASKIGKADHLEDPGDLVQYLKDNMTAAGGRDLVVELLPNTWNFKEWMVGYGLHVQGLTSTHCEPHANHVWRFAKRFMIETEDVENHHPDWQTLEEHPQDVILQVKQFMSSAGLSQKPQLLPSVQLFSDFFRLGANVFMFFL